MEKDYDSDSDAPEELSIEEGVKQDKELEKVLKENSIRVAREGKERRRLWAQRNAPQKSSEDDGQEVKQTEQPPEETEQPQEGMVIKGMLPSNIVELLAAREKKTFSDSEEEILDHKPTAKKKRRKTSSGPQTLLLKEIPPAQCQQNSLDFLKRRKMQVPRSSAVLKNSKQALRLLSARGNLLSKS